ncbi:hypothetical protein MPDQ_005562 [Monascus purpureus]|uniref:Laccase, multicopper oxidase, benzenediol:oxygen oxidorectuctase n=1 Tax=Monascus purpureus TaxID=5098 RepID=A0A507R6U7_MONPU|nr:hypothetical protein MPDQ_005562 [Monascus purpureus]
MDGAAGITQCAIPPGNTFTYNFTIPLDQSGTFWYHSHSGISRADGLYGGFVVHTPASKSSVRGLMTRSSPADLDKYKYDKELLLLIGDWYHRSAGQVLAWYMRAGSFGNEPVPDSLLINGVGHFDCSMAVPARPVDCIAIHVNSSYLDLDRNAFYRVRVVNTGSLAGFTLVFGHEHLELIQLDSIEVEPQQKQGVNSAGILYPGQRMDFVLRSPADLDTRQPSSVTVQLDRGCFKYPNPALLPDQTFPISPIPNDANNKENEVPPWKPNTTTLNRIDIEKFASSSTILANMSAKAQQTHVVYTKIQKLSINNNVPYGFFNRTSWRPQQDPPIPLTGLARQKWDRNQFSFSTGPEPVWVDLVVNNLDEGPHPFHLHGHHFYVLTTQKASIGWGSYSPFVDPYPPGLEPSREDHTPYNLTKATLRDTTQIPSRGYAVLRFRADNPGVWLFHCHITWHLASGMAMLVDVMGDEMGVGAHEAGMGMCLSVS